MRARERTNARQRHVQIDGSAREERGPAVLDLVRGWMKSYPAGASRVALAWRAPYACSGVGLLGVWCAVRFDSYAPAIVGGVQTAVGIGEQFAQLRLMGQPVGVVLVDGIQPRLGGAVETDHGPCGRSRASIDELNMRIVASGDVVCELPDATEAGNRSRIGGSWA
jgi:hypothetical protein